MAGTRSERVSTRYKGGKADAPGHVDGAGGARKDEMKSTRGHADDEKTTPTEAGEKDGKMDMGGSHVEAHAVERKAMRSRHEAEIKDHFRHTRETHRSMLDRHEKEMKEMAGRHEIMISGTHGGRDGEAGGSREA